MALAFNDLDEEADSQGNVLSEKSAIGCTADSGWQTKMHGGGKADDSSSCPANATLNSGSGSQRRCIDADSGQFIATACCAQVCAGADWQPQTNGERCI